MSEIAYMQCCRFGPMGPKFVVSFTFGRQKVIKESLKIIANLINNNS